METIWNGLVICDYERTRPWGDLLEWSLYTIALTSWPRELMDSDTPFGTRRRGRIVDIPIEVHDTLTHAWHRRLADPDYLERLGQRTGAWTAAARAAIDRARHISVAEPSAREALIDATGPLIRLTTTHIVNWLLPEEQWITDLADVLGDPDAAQQCLHAWLIPPRPGALLAESPTDAAAVRMGAEASRDRWRERALALARTPQAQRGVETICTAASWAAGCEEARKPLRDGFLDIARTWCGQHGVDPARADILDAFSPTVCTEARR